MKREKKRHRMPFTGPNLKLLSLGLKTQTRRLRDRGYRRGDIILVNERHFIGPQKSGVVIQYDQRIYQMPAGFTYTQVQLPTDIIDRTYSLLRLRPPMFMPNFAVRFVLKVEGVRHQRIKRMGWRDVEAEGIELHTSLRGKMKDAHARERFANEVWDPINPVHPFDTNPEVTVVTFRLFPYLCDHSPMRTPDMIERDEVYAGIFGREGTWTSKGFGS